MTKIFISHSSTDNDFARQLAQALTDVGIDVWIDLANIPAGMKWNNAIQQGLKECKAMIVILSPEAMESDNVGDEWLYYHQRRKKIFTVLWKPTEDIHFQLEPIQYVNFHSREFDSAFRHLSEELKRSGIRINGTDGELHVIRSSNHQPTIRVEDILPPPFEWVEIPEGMVTLEDDSHWGGTSGGLYKISGFKIAKYPITNAQYQVFVDTQDGYSNPKWWNYYSRAARWRADHERPASRSFPNDDHPRANVTWFDAIAFCFWLESKCATNILNEKVDLRFIILPTEQQWQRAAVGDTDNVYPWGNDFDINKCNSVASGLNQTTAVTRYPKGASPYGVMDMSGNVWEWCLTKWRVDKSDLGGATSRCNRGGAYIGNEYSAKACVRSSNAPHYWGSWVGFRIVQNL